MEIIDLSDYHKNTYIKCLEDWSDEMAEAGDKYTTTSLLWKNRKTDRKTGEKEKASVSRGLKSIEEPATSFCNQLP